MGLAPRPIFSTASQKAAENDGPSGPAEFLNGLPAPDRSHMMNDTRPGHSDTLTQGVRVRVAAELVDQGMSDDGEVWLYAYRVIISNEGEIPVTLRRRHWIISDADGGQEEVEGPGVVGEEPRLEPGDEHEYQSACPLRTHWGTMEGSYTMELDNGARFPALIGRFFLAETTAPMAELDQD